MGRQRIGSARATLLGVAAAVFSIQTKAAEPAADAAATESPSRLDPVIVTGTRSPGRAALASPVPIDVINGEQLRATGYSDLARALQFSVPSVNFPRAHTTPSSANTRPITVRGLSPDEVLVLVNGKRWHVSSVINTNFAVGRGSAPFDLSTIPVVAIDHIEILRDGAAAQYGSDAIAGVINIILRSDAGGGVVQAGTGITERGDGGYGDVAINKGFAIGGGHLNLSVELLSQNGTNRAAVDQRYGRVTYVIGDPDALNFNAVADAAFPVFAGSEFYETILLSRKDSRNVAGFRAPGSSPLFPDGFGPEINPVIVDTGVTLGLRGALAALIRYDFSNTYGSSTARFTDRNTANLSLAAASPTSFDAGTARYIQDTVNLTISRPLTELWSGGNLAVGGEYRHENYDLERGEFASYTGSGAAGFPGFNPRIPVDNGRNAVAAFVDLEVKPLKALSLGAAARYDDYSDFGSAVTGKLTARFAASRWLALRASGSTGFRAPSLQQQYYSSITSVANGTNKAIVNVGTYQVRDPVAQSLGATPLEAEKSRNLTAGVVLTPVRRLSFSADVFRTDIDRRIALSDALSGPSVIAALTSAGITDVQQAAFFTNAANTRTQGYELTLRYFGDFTVIGDDDSHYDFTLGYGRTPTTLRSVATNPALPALPLLGRRSLQLLTTAQPEDKFSSQFTLSHGPYSATVAATRFGQYSDAPIRDPQLFNARTLIDLSLSAGLGYGAVVTVGALNVGDIYPDELQQQALAFSSFGGSFTYGEGSPSGIAGRSYYLRLAVDLP